MTTEETKSKKVVTVKKETLLKLVVLGDSAVGKTAFLHKFVNDLFIEEHRATIGADFMTKKIQLSSMNATLQLWDTAGQERFNSLGSTYYRGSDGVIFVFDITNKKSFQNIPVWKKLFDEHLDIQHNNDNDDEKHEYEFPYLLLGSKCDLENSREVTKEEAQKYADRNNMIFYEVSSLDGTNVDNCINDLVETAIEITNNIVIEKFYDKNNLSLDNIQLDSVIYDVKGHHEENETPVPQSSWYCCT